jgi:hypothetical protein
MGNWKWNELEQREQGKEEEEEDSLQRRMKESLSFFCLFFLFCDLIWLSSAFRPSRLFNENKERVYIKSQRKSLKGEKKKRKKEEEEEEKCCTRGLYRCERWESAAAWIVWVVEASKTFLASARPRAKKELASIEDDERRRSTSNAERRKIPKRPAKPGPRKKI